MIEFWPSVSLFKQPVSLRQLAIGGALPTDGRPLTLYGPDVGSNTDHWQIRQASDGKIIGSYDSYGSLFIGGTLGLKDTTLPVPATVMFWQYSGTWMFHNVGLDYVFYQGATARLILGPNSPTGVTSTSRIVMTPGGVCGIVIGSGTISAPINGLYVAGRTIHAEGVAIAAANNLVLGADGNTFHITGATQINLLSILNWLGGADVTLIFDSNPLVKHNQAASGNNKPIFLKATADFQAAANKTLHLVYDTTNATWYEV